MTPALVSLSRRAAAALVLPVVLSLAAALPARAGSLDPVTDRAVVLPQEPAVPDVGRRQRLGIAFSMTNDFFGDRHDRWRTGSMMMSYVRGPAWDGTAPAGFGDLIEFRLMSQVIAPVDLITPNPTDRPYAGAISLGVHTHMERRGIEMALGADLVVIGPQTGISSLHDDLHELFGSTRPSSAMLAGQIADTIRPTLVAEVGRSFDLGPSARLRPFVEARAGDETLLRLGADLIFGPAGRGELLVRDPVTGQRSRVVANAEPGFSFLLGADIAYVADSVYLPSSRGYTLSDHRDRLRAGLYWQGRRTGLFFGMTYLGEEFTAQPESQVVGTLQLKVTF